MVIINSKDNCFWGSRAALRLRLWGSDAYCSKSNASVEADTPELRPPIEIVNRVTLAEKRISKCEEFDTVETN